MAANHTEQVGDDSERELRFVRPAGTKRRLLTDTDVQRYSERGFIMPVTLFSSEEITGHRRYFEQLQKKAAEAGHDAYSVMNWQKFCGGVYDLAYSPRVLDLVEELLAGRNRYGVQGVHLNPLVLFLNPLGLFLRTFILFI